MPMCFVNLWEGVVGSIPQTMTMDPFSSKYLRGWVFHGAHCWKRGFHGFTFRGFTFVNAGINQSMQKEDLTEWD